MPTRNRIYARALAIARRNPVDEPTLRVRDALAAIVFACAVTAVLPALGLMLVGVLGR